MYSRSFEFAAVSLWPRSFAKWCESKHKVQSSVDWELNCKVVYIGKKKKERVCIHKKKKTTKLMMI